MVINQSLTKLFEEADKIETHTINQCLNCGAILESDYATKCEICGYDSINEFTCPYKITKSIKLPDKVISLDFCELTKKQCKVDGLDFEVCSTFRSLDTLKMDD